MLAPLAEMCGVLLFFETTVITVWEFLGAVEHILADDKITSFCLAGS